MGALQDEKLYIASVKIRTQMRAGTCYERVTVQLGQLSVLAKQGRPKQRQS